jgi:glycosyltransferase involved in cell wall biosynthesis
MAGKSSAIPHIALGRFRSDLAVKNSKFSMCHAGSLGLRGPDIFLNGVRRFLDRTGLQGSISVNFVGPPLESLQATVSQLSLDRVVSVQGPKTYEETQGILAMADVLVVLEPPFDKGVFFPSKFVDLVQTGRPILAVSPVDGTISDIVSANGGGIVADCRYSDAVAKAVERLYSAWVAGTLDSDYGSAHLFGLFSEEHVLGQYAEVFDRIKR